MVLWLALALLLQDDGVELRWKYPKGETIRYRMSQKVSSEVNGTPVRQQMATTVALAVKDVDEKGVVTLEARYEAVAARASGVQEYDYDSEKDKEPPDDPAARMMSKLVGQSFGLTMSAAGKVLEVKGYEKLVEAMSRGVADDEAGRERARQALAQMFSDEAFKSRMQQLAPPLPEGRLKKDSDLLLDQLRAIDNARLIEGPMLQCSADFMMLVDAALREVLDLLAVQS